MKIRNVSDYGTIDVPLLGREGEPHDTEGTGCLQPGEVLDVSEEHAHILLMQPANFVPADDEGQAIGDEISEAEDLTAPPARTANKPAWVAWATKYGDPDPEAKTVAQLQELYGPNEGEQL